MASYTPRNLYEESFAMNFNWEKHLYSDVYRFHDLMRRELSTPIELQMGTVLPFIGACCGPETKAIFFTQPSVLNIFWMNIAASGVGKSQSRKFFPYVDIFDMSLQQVLLYFYIKIIRNVSVITHVIRIN